MACHRALTPTDKEHLQDIIEEKEHVDARTALRQQGVRRWKGPRADVQALDRLLGALQGDLTADRRYCTQDELKAMMDFLEVKTQFCAAPDEAPRPDTEVMIWVRNSHYLHKQV